MKVKANLNHLRISAKKVRLVADLIRDMDVKEAETQLKFLTKGAAEPILKLLNSAAANAQHSFDIEKDNLFVSEIQVNEGPVLKRWRSRAMGRAAPIMKRTSYVNLVLETKKEVKKTKKKKPKPEVVKAEEVKKEKSVEAIKEPVVKAKPPKKIIKKPKFKGLTKKIFRRKSF